MGNITKIDVMHWASMATMLWLSIKSIYVLWKYRTPPKHICIGGLWVNKKQSEYCPAIPVNKIEMIAINDLGDSLYVNKEGIS